ncbi:MAG: hypothetical protein R3A48_04795 [Polyangiales bacterium]
MNPIDGSPLLPLVNVVGMGNVRALIFPERHTLWFARGAVLQLAPGVVVIIRGSIIADPTQIFDLPEVRARLSNPTSTEPAGTALVRFESTRIEEIYPEWFGVVPGFSSTTPAYASASAAAYQACLHAAVRDRDRDGVSLPPLTVVSNGVYSVNETLEVLSDANGSDGTLCVVGSYLGGEMQVVTRAAQSVLLASRTTLSGNRAETPAGWATIQSFLPKNWTQRAEELRLCPLDPLGHRREEKAKLRIRG